MRIALDRADIGAFRVDLPGTAKERISVRSAQGLRATIERGDDRLTLSGVAAENVELDALRILLGSLVLSSASGATLEGLGLSLDQVKSQLSLTATLAGIDARDLELAVDDILVRGQAKLVSPNLVVRGEEGSLSSTMVEIKAFVLRIGEIELAADVLRGSDVKVAWGAAGFRLSATSLEAPDLRMTTPEVQLLAGGVAVASFALAGKALSIARAALASGQLAISFRPSTTASSEPAAEATTTEPLFDWRVLDALSGQFDVDAAVDLTVPIIGRRRATHRLRIAIDSGTIDYRALESNLSKLEDALLDFSVRDGALVLERVNPLFPARGHGKPIIIWDVDAADLELARRDRVRLSVLPKARLAKDAEEEVEQEREPSKSSIALRELGLLRINARLALAPVEGALAGQLRPRHVGSFTLAGSVFHEPGGSREGSALGELSDLSAALHQLALGTSRLDAARLSATGIAPIEIEFADVNPKKLQLGLSGVVLEEIALAL